MTRSEHALPPGWIFSNADTVCQMIQDGTHFSPKDQGPTGEHLYITAKNVRNRGLDLTDVSYISEAEHRPIYDRCSTLEGDVLLVKDGVNTGDAAINTIKSEISLLSSVCMLRPHPGLLISPYLRYFLQSPEGRNALSGKMSGTAIRRIILKYIRALMIPIAPKHEQHRIVGAIESYLSRLDAAVEALKRVQRNLTRYRASVLQAAVEGRLVPTEAELAREEGRDYEPAGELLERILIERRRRWEEVELTKLKATYKEPAAPDTEELPKLPEGWAWSSIPRFADHRLGKMLDKAKNVGTSRPYLRNINVRWFHFDLADLREMRITDDEFPNVSVESGDLLVCEGGEPGRCAVWKDTSGSIAIQKALHRVRPHSDISAEFLAIVLAAHAESGRLETVFTGSTIKHLTGTALCSYPFPIPPKSEQVSIAMEVKRLLSDSDLIAQDLKRAHQQVELLRQSTLKWAFEGKLVDQDPADEPASILLEQIMAERNSQARNRRSRTPRARHKAKKL